MPDEDVPQRSRRSLGLFRREAVEDHAQGFQDAGEVLRLSPVWGSWAFWLLAAVSVLAVLATAVYPYREEAEGVVAGVASPGAQGGWQVLLPARLRSLLTPGRELEAEGVRLAVRSLEGGSLGGEEVRRRLHLPPGAPLPVETPAVLILAVPVAAPATVQVHGRVRLATEPLVYVLVPRLRPDRG